MPSMTSSEAKGQICEFVNIYGLTLTKNELLHLVRQARESVKSRTLLTVHRRLAAGKEQGRQCIHSALLLLLFPILRLISLWSPQSNILNLGPEKGSNTLENNSEEEELTETTNTTEEEFQEEISYDELAATTTDDDDWTYAKPTYKTSKVYAYEYKRSVKIQGEIISLICSYMLDMSIEQLTLVVDLMWHRLYSEKVAREFFPRREAMWFALKNCKYLLKQVGEIDD